jgi:hypothetical protein
MQIVVSIAMLIFGLGPSSVVHSLFTTFVVYLMIMMLPYRWVAVSCLEPCLIDADESCSVRHSSSVSVISRRGLVLHDVADGLLFALPAISTACTPTVGSLLKPSSNQLQILAGPWTSPDHK